MSPAMGDIFNISTDLGRLGLLGFALFVLVAVTAAFLMEWVVPGSTHRREIARGDKLEATNEKLAESIDTMTDIIKTARRGH